MPRSPYAREFIEEAVRLVREGGKKRVDVAQDLGVSSESLRQSLQQHVQAMSIRPVARVNAGPVSGREDIRNKCVHYPTPLPA